MYHMNSVTTSIRTEAREEGAKRCCVLTVHVADFAVLDC